MVKAAILVVGFGPEGIGKAGVLVGRRLARQDAALGLLQEGIFEVDRQRVDGGGDGGVVGGEDHFQLHEAARALRLEGLVWGLVLLAPGVPVLADDDSGVDRTL